jgi:hypothetical protein
MNIYLASFMRVLPGLMTANDQNLLQKRPFIIR